MGLKVTGGRFYDRDQRFSYPINVVVYNNKSLLGYFDSNFFELGFHESLMHTSRVQLENVIKHEVAHYINFINLGEAIQPHGPEFRALCQSIGWGEEVYRATTCLEGELKASDTAESNVLRKVHKLMALSTSSNPNEAELAMIKSQQLLLKHNLESKYMDNDDNEKISLKRILKQKKENAKMRSIARILETFFVSTVFNRAGDFTYLEILGDAVNLEIAEYVASILDTELERLWEKGRQGTSLKGATAKNSFFLGIAKGYCSKIQALKRSYSDGVTHALMVIEKKLTDGKAMAYPRLFSTKSSAAYCWESSKLGEKMGRELSINPAINKSSSISGNLIGFDI